MTVLFQKQIPQIPIKTICLLVFLYAAMGWAQTFGPRQVIDEQPGALRMVRAADLDGDSDMDLVIAATPAIAWYENLDGQGTFVRHIIDEGMGQSFSIDIGRMDNNGSTDVVVSYFDMDMVGWYSNMGGGSFASFAEIASGLNNASGVTIVPIDGDSDNDLVLGVSNGNGLYWVENIGNTGNFGSLLTIDANIAQARTQAVGDLDGDGDLDIVTNSGELDATVAWFENTDGEGVFGSRQVVDATNFYENTLALVDLDGDENLDVVSENNSQVIWRANTNGNGNFGPINVISDVPSNIQEVYYGDFDLDDDMDVVSVSADDNTVAWYENTDGLGNFGPQQVIDSDLKSPRTVFAADLDGDGDLDIVSAALEPGGGERQLVWYENLTILGNQDIKEPIVYVYPNPVSEILHIQSRDPLQQVTFYDVLGQSLMTVHKDFENIPVSNLPAGVYFVEVQTLKGVLVKRVVKE